MKAAQVLRFCPLNVITKDDLPQQEPATGQLLFRVEVAGAGHKKQSTLTLEEADNEQDVFLLLTPPDRAW